MLTIILRLLCAS